MEDTACIRITFASPHRHMLPSLDLFFSFASLLFCYLLSFPFPLTRPLCISAPFDIDFTLLSQVNCLSFKLWIFPHFLKLPSPLFGSDSPLTLPSSLMTIEPPAGFCKVHFWRLPPLVAHTSPVHCNNLHSLTTVFIPLDCIWHLHTCVLCKNISWTIFIFRLHLLKKGEWRQRWNLRESRGQLFHPASFFFVFSY